MLQNVFPTASSLMVYGYYYKAIQVKIRGMPIISMQSVHYYYLCVVEGVDSVYQQIFKIISFHFQN